MTQVTGQKWSERTLVDDLDLARNYRLGLLDPLETDAADRSKLITAYNLLREGMLTRRSDYILTARDRGNFIIASGSNALEFTLPDINGTTVEVGWSVYLINNSSATLTISTDGRDVIDGSSTREVPSGEAIRVLAVSRATWTVIVDTEQGSGGSGPDGIPDAPAHTSEVKKYALQVPANSGPETWVDAGGAAVDQTARDAAAVAKSTADSAQTDATANFRQIESTLRTANNAVSTANDARTIAERAQLDADTIIEVNEDFTVGETTARNMNISIQHPLNAYRTANTVAVSVQGQPAVLVTYNPALLQQTVQAGLTTQVLQNIGTRLVAGGFITVDITFQIGTGRFATGHPQAGQVNPNAIIGNKKVEVPVKANRPQVIQALTPAAQVINDNNEAILQTLQIVPQSTGSRVRISGAVEGQITTGGQRGVRDGNFTIRLYRGTTLLLSRTYRASQYAQNETVIEVMNIDYVDSPASAARQTYTLRGIRGAALSWSLTDRQLIANEVL